MRNLFILLLILLSACDEDAQPYTNAGNTDTFLQRMATHGAQATTCAVQDSTLDCKTVLYWMLLTSDLSRKNAAYDTVLNIRRHSYTIAHTIGNNDSMLIWVSYKADDTATIKTIAWLQMDLKSRQLYDVTDPRRQPPIFYDTAQLSAIHCNCIYNGSKDAGEARPQLRDLKLIRNRRYSDEPDYGKIF